MLADKWQVPHVSSAAAQMLADAAYIPGALAKAVQQRVLQDAALPAATAEERADVYVW